MFAGGRIVIRQQYAGAKTGWKRGLLILLEIEVKIAVTQFVLTARELNPDSFGFGRLS
jgi:hypothetical protein